MALDRMFRSMWASVTKSVLSALTGIAVDKGYIPSVSRRIMEYLPEYVSETHNRNCGNVTIENLLTMTVPYAFEEWKEPLEQLYISRLGGIHPGYDEG